MASVIVGDGYIAGILTFPAEAHAVLVIDSDAVLPRPVTLERLEPVAWGKT